jgi:hypothetical protein
MTNRKPHSLSLLAKRFRVGRIASALIVMLPALLAAHAAQAQSYTILHNFGLKEGDPQNPTSLILG